MTYRTPSKPMLFYRRHQRRIWAAIQPLSKIISSISAPRRVVRGRCY